MAHPGPGDGDLTQLFSHRGRLRGTRFQQGHDELIASKSSQDVRLTQVGFQFLSHLLEHEIPHVVSKGVVDPLEPIDIDHETAQRPAIPPGPFALPLPPLKEKTTVVEPGQLIGGGELAQALGRASERRSPAPDCPLQEPGPHGQQPDEANRRQSRQHAEGHQEDVEGRDGLDRLGGSWLHLEDPLDGVEPDGTREPRVA